jgi:hypothetical protein
VEASVTLTHELGHNFDRKHVLCAGNENNIDEEFPYSGGSIGVFGLDVLEKLLYSPSTYKDFMSYCTKVWTSDYTYWNIHQFRQNAAAQDLSSESPQDAIYVSGSINGTGELELGYVYRQTVPVFPQEDGEYRVDLLDADGEILATYPFQVVEVADSQDAFHFGFFVPYEEGMDGLRIRLGGRILGEKFVVSDLVADGLTEQGLSIQVVEGESRLVWTAVDHPGEPVVYRLRLSRDGGKTWQVLALDWPEPAYPVPENFESAVGPILLEVQASDGIHTSTSVYEYDLFLDGVEP